MIRSAYGLIRRCRWFGACFLLTLPLQSLAQSIDKPDESASTAAAPAAQKPTASFSTEMLLKLLMAERSFSAGDYETAFNTYWNYARLLKSPQFAERAAQILVLTENRWRGTGENPYGQLKAVVDYWFKLDRTSMLAFGLALRIDFFTGDFNRFSSLLKRALAEHPELAGSYWNTVRLFFQDIPPTLFDQGSTLVTRLAPLSPNQAEARMTVAEMALRTDRRAEAAEAAKAAARLRPDWDEPVIMQAEMLLSDGETDRAKALLSGFLEKNPTANRVKLLLAEANLFTGDDEAAFAAYRQLASVKPEDVNLSVQTARLALKLDQRDLAITYFEQALLYEADDARRDQILLWLAQTMLMQNRTDDALPVIAQIKDDQAKLRGRFSYIEALNKADRTDEATEYLLKAYRDADERTRPAYAAAASVFLRKTGQTPRLKTFLAEALTIDPDDAALLYESAMLAEVDGDYVTSEAALRRLIEVRPTHAHAYNALGYSFADRNVHLDEARKLLETAITLAPNDHHIQDSMGWLEFRMGNYEKAIEWLTKSYDKVQEPEVAAHLGEVYWTMGDRDKALEIWRAASKATDSSHPILEKTIERLYGRPL